jgi:hypothetical protein
VCRVCELGWVGGGGGGCKPELATHKPWWYPVAVALLTWQQLRADAGLYVYVDVCPTASRPTSADAAHHLSPQDEAGCCPEQPAGWLQPVEELQGCGGCTLGCCFHCFKHLHSGCGSVGGWVAVLVGGYTGEAHIQAWVMSIKVARCLCLWVLWCLL